MYDIITIGAATQDVFLISSGSHIMRDTYRACTMECFPVGEKIPVSQIMHATGGGATNTAATFHALGFRVGTVVRIADDPAGDYIIKDLKERGLPMRFIQKVEGATSGFSAILLTPHGDRTALVHRGVSGMFTARDIPWKDLHARWLFVTSLNGNLPLVRRIFRFARSKNIHVAFNPGLLELRAGISGLGEMGEDINTLFLNRSEAALLAGSKEIGKIRRRLANHFPHGVVVTDGAKGAYYWDQQRGYHASITPVNVVNTTGAGDAFGSGFISGILRWRDPVRALQLAILNAQGTIQQMGAKRGLLTRWPTVAAMNRIRIKKI